MPWWIWLWIGASVLSAASRVALVGQPRKPYTKSEAIGAVIGLPFTIWLLTYIGSRF